MKAVHVRIVASAFALAIGMSAIGPHVPDGNAETRDSVTHLSDADTVPIRFHPADSVIKLDVGTFGPCAQDFDLHTRVASLYCPKVGSPEEREFVFINVYLSNIWADSVNAESVARTLRDSGQPGLVAEGAFSAPAQQTSTALTYFLAQTHVQPGESFGNVYLTVVSQAENAVVAILYGQRFEVSNEDLRARERRWLANNLTTHFRQLIRISLDSAFIAALRSLAR